MEKLKSKQLQLSTKQIYGKYLNSPLGDILIAADDEAIKGLWFVGQKYMDQTVPEGIEIYEKQKVLLLGEDWLKCYFKKEVFDCDLPLHPVGNAFRQTVWQILREISAGKSLEQRQAKIASVRGIYDELGVGDAAKAEIAKLTAKSLGKERMSAQAVGGAVGHNPISIMIPCHRVLGADGRLTGYAGGVDRKEWLLRHEGYLI